MDKKVILDGLLMYVGLVVLLTFHEVGHAWMAWKCGDDTAKLQGRISLNPLVHIDPIGTVLMPLLMIYLSATSHSELGRFLIGWAKPVPVNPANLRNGRADDTLVAMAGPWMNLVLAVALMILARVGWMVHSDTWVWTCIDFAKLSLLLCFFNLIPVPPLDGSHVVKNLIGMSYEFYWKICRFSFLLVILVMQIRQVQVALHAVTKGSLRIIAGWVGLGSLA